MPGGKMVPVTSWPVERSRLANAVRNNRPAEAQEARRSMVAGRLEEYIAKTLAAAPPLTDEQRSRLALLLHGSTPDGGAAA
jgi:hypothetical protein